MTTTGIFGGSFNPVHNGHIELARRLLGLAGLDEIWFVVSPQNPFKRNERLLDDCLRLEMVRLALKDEPHMAPSDYEFRMPRPSYMWHTLQSMSADYPVHSAHRSRQLGPLRRMVRRRRDTRPLPNSGLSARRHASGRHVDACRSDPCRHRPDTRQQHGRAPPHSRRRTH